MRGMKWFAVLLAGTITLVQWSCGFSSDSGKERQQFVQLYAVFAADSLNEDDVWTRYTTEQRRGKRLFDHYCVVCHGPGGEGDGFNSYNLDPRPHSLADSAYMAAVSDASLAEIIRRGGRGVNRSVMMPAYGELFSDDQIRYLVDYIRTLPASIKEEE